MRIPNRTMDEQDWLIGELVEGFRLEDVWAHPDITGDESRFADVVTMLTAGDPTTGTAPVARFLWNVRDRLGRWFDLGSITTTAEPAEGTLRSRVPDALRGSADDVTFTHLPFVPLYRTDDEFAAEIVNRTVHGVMHLAWVDEGTGRFHAQMAVYVKPAGLFGRAYMAFIKPFRYLIVYPALERQLGRRWAARTTA